MHILMLLERQFPYDERVEKEACSLISSGHKVSVLSYNHGNMPLNETYKDIDVFRFSISQNMFNKLNPLHRVFPLYGLIWKKHIRKLLKTQSFDVIHVHDLPLANIGFWFKKKTGCKLILDQHELWSETVKHYRHYNTFIGKIVRYLSRWSSYEKKQFHQADKIITVEEPIKQWYIEKYKLSEDKIIVASNTPLKKQIDALSFTEEREHKNFILFYAGKIDVNRYLVSVIKALKILSSEIPEIQFQIAGKYAHGCDPRILAKKNKVIPYTKYLGMLPYDQMMQEMKKADICISLLPSNSEELNRTIVTKVYQYLQLQKPMIVGLTTYIKNFVESSHIGIAVDETSPQDIAKAVLYLYKHPDQLKKYSENAALIKDAYVWEKSIKDLLNYYKQVENKS